MKVGAGFVVVLVCGAIGAIGAGGAIVGCTAGGSSGGGQAGEDAGDGAAHDGTATDAASMHDANNDGASDGGVTDAMVDASDDGPACMLVGGGIGVPACDTCLGQKCCDKWNTCFNDTDCLDLFACTGNCPDAGDAGGCIYDCQQLHMGAVPSFNALITCLGVTCKTPCGL